MSDPYPFLDNHRTDAHKELAGAIGFAVACMAIVTTGLLAWIKWGGH